MNDDDLWDTCEVEQGGTAVCSKGDPTKQMKYVPDGYDYSLYFFKGWHSEKGRESPESGILENIQSSKTVYAAFEYRGAVPE